jgi:hypothetical protein
MRERLVATGYYGQILPGRISWPAPDPATGHNDFGTAEEWMENMKGDAFYGDHVMLQVAANVFNRDIVLLPVFRWVTQKNLFWSISLNTCPVL